MGTFGTDFSHEYGRVAWTLERSSTDYSLYSRPDVPQLLAVKRVVASGTTTYTYAIITYTSATFNTADHAALTTLLDTTWTNIATQTYRPAGIELGKAFNIG